MAIGDRVKGAIFTVAYPWRFAATVLLCAVILFLRTPEMFAPHNLTVEDGVIFFADAFNRTPLDAILTPYAGYYHLAPRLIAEVGSHLPLALVPPFYALAALLLSSIASAWFYLPHFRPVVGHDDLRLAFVLLVVLLPGMNTPLWMSYSQWLIALWGCLLVLMAPPRRLWAQWALAFAYLAALATAPALFVLFPLWVWRMVKAPNGSQRVWMGVILAATLLMAAATAQVQRTEPSLPVDWALLVTDVTRSFAFRLFVSPFLGHVLSNEIVRTLGWPALFVLALVVAVSLLIAVAASMKRGASDKAATYLAVAYIAASTSALYILRSPFYGYLFASATTAPLHSMRYHFLGICAVLLLCLMVLDHLLAQRRISRSLIWVGLLIVFLLHSPNFRIAHWGADRSWPRTVHLLTHRIDAASPDAVAWSASYPQPASLAPGNGGDGVHPLRVPILPAGWTMVLLLPPGSPQGYLFPEGPRLLSVDSRVAGDELQIELFWQTPGDQEYTAFVHLLDEGGTRIGGADIRLEPPLVPQIDRSKPPAPATPETVWSTLHVVPLPPGLEPGSYDVAVGLYKLAQEQLLPGSTVIVRDQLHIKPPE